MRSKLLIAAAFVAALVVSLAPAVVAHHSVSAEFDVNNKVTFTGTVKRVDWMNPHIYVHVEVKEADGKITVWKVEGGPPNSMFRQGLRAETLALGTRVTCTACSRSKSKTSMNVNGRFTREDGSALFTSPQQ
jgi:hypothetical protein